MDWYSRYVIAWEVSVSLDSSFCLSILDRALDKGQPEIFNSDQGAQFTSEAFVERLRSREIRISWDGRGRALDNVFVERLWRTVKYEEVYIKDYVETDAIMEKWKNKSSFPTFPQSLGKLGSRVFHSSHSFYYWI